VILEGVNYDMGIIMIDIIKTKSLLLVFTIFISGCAGFQSNQISIISPDADFLVESETMTYSITKDATYGGLEVFNDVLISEMNSYGWVLRQNSIVKDEMPHLEINLSLSKDPAALLAAALTGFSFYTIPSWETSDYKLTANLIDASGNEYTYELRDQVVLVQWLPLLLIFPFADPFTAEKKLIGKMYNNLGYRISKDITVSSQLSKRK
jgi:hypothetical protein